MYKQLLVLIFIISFGFSSEKGGKVVYEVILERPKTIGKPENSMSKKLNDQINYYSTFLEKLETELIFSDINSSYKIKYMDVDSQVIPKYIKVIFNLNDEYFVDLSQKNNFRQEDFNEKKFLVKTENQKLNWKITDDVKTINGIKVKKAVFVSDSKQHPKTINVWYAPSIPYNFGPAEFSFFPGLVLEVNVLSEFTYTLKAKEIIIDKKFKVKPLPKLEVITQEKLDEFYEKIRDNQKSLIKNK